MSNKYETDLTSVPKFPQDKNKQLIKSQTLMKVPKFKLHRRKLQSELKDVMNYSNMKSRYYQILKHKDIKRFQKKSTGPLHAHQSDK